MFGLSLNNYFSQIMTVWKWTAEWEFHPDRSEHWNLMDFANCPKIILITLQFEYWIVWSSQRSFVITVKAEVILSYAEEWDSKLGKRLSSIFLLFGPWSDYPGPAPSAPTSQPNLIHPVSPGFITALCNRQQATACCWLGSFCCCSIAVRLPKL